MFHVSETRPGRGSQWTIGGLALLIVLTLVLTVWILADFRHEQEIVRELTQHLPASDLPDAKELAGDLQLQSRLSILLFLNIVASCIALTLLVRAYLTSERSLREVKVLATDILASMDQGVITTDRDGKILSINPRGRELLHQPDDGAEISLQELPGDHGTLNEICRHVLHQKGSVRDRDYVASLNGHARTLRAGCSLLRDECQRNLGTVIHVRDVTERALIEQRLRRMERYMGLGSLATGLLHEIKNPLSALSLHVQLLEESLAEYDTTPDIQNILQVLNTEVSRIAGVLEGFRDFASVSVLHKGDVDLSQLLRKLARLMEPQAKQQHVAITTVFPFGEPPRLMADSTRLEQVLLNLVLNALEAMPEGGQLTLRIETSPDTVRIEVGDTGRGIPDDLRDRVFDPYFTTRHSGTGMGLALSEKIVRQHDGTIDFSTGPEGTVFSVSLPRIQTHDA